MPSVVVKSTVTVCSLSVSSVTVKTKLLPSVASPGAVTAIATASGVSWIVAVADAVPIDTLPQDRPAGLVRARSNVSSHSFTASSVEATGTVSDSTPGLNVSVPLVDV